MSDKMDKSDSIEKEVENKELIKYWQRLEWETGKATSELNLKDSDTVE